MRRHSRFSLIAAVSLVAAALNVYVVYVTDGFAETYK